ncbi:MAG: hypothetical protein HOV97_33165, partial [Nonomuraea sp.]|nr:hypothetical protein [Nonomuraea sp.]
GGLLLAVCCASLVNAASDSDQMLDRAQSAHVVTHTATASPPAVGLHQTHVRPIR